MAQPDFAANDDSTLEGASAADPERAQARSQMFEAWANRGAANPFVARPIGYLRDASVREDAMPDEISKEELAANLRAVSAETDTKIARMEGKMDLVLSKLDGVSARLTEVRTDVMEGTRANRANAYVVFFGLAGIIVALLVAIPAFYDFGGKQRDTIRDEVKQQIEVQKPPAAKP